MPSNDITTAPALAENNDLQTPSAATEKTEQPGLAAQLASTAPQAQQTVQVQDQPSYDHITWPVDVAWEPAQVQAFKSLASQLQLSEEQVQKLVDFESQSARDNAAKAGSEKREIIADWARQTKAIYGANLEEEISFALRAANVFGGPEFRALLEETGLGNHPIMLRTLVEIGHSISEDACPGGQPAAPQDKTFAEALYGKR